MSDNRPPGAEGVAMPDGSWYYTKAGRRLGPFTFDQLRQMAGAGLIAPDDPVTRDGDAGGVAAAAVPGLLAPPPAPADRPPVRCEACRADVSDLAEHCPRCGHPQPPLRAKEAGEDLPPCPHCGTHNRVRGPHEFYAGACRGCGRPLAEAYPAQRREAQVDAAYHACELSWAAKRWSVLLYGCPAAGYAVCVAVEYLLPAHRLQAFLAAGCVAAWYAFQVYEAAYWLAFVAGRPQPPDAAAVGFGEWVVARGRAERERVRRGRPAIPDRWSWLVGVLPVVALFALDLWVQLDRERTRRRAAVGSEMTRLMTATKSEGLFSHDVLLESKALLGWRACDLTVTVQLAGGKRVPVTVPWPVWSFGEQKKVNVPAGGRVERVEVAGTMVDALTGETGRVAAAFDWKAGGK